jgi:hypothetical protein
MTMLDVLIKVLSEFFGKTERDLADWADVNMTDTVREKLEEPLPPEKAQALLEEFRKNPLAVMTILARGVSGHSKPN